MTGGSRHPQGPRRPPRALGSRLQYAVFELLVRCRALPLARALLIVVVLYYTLLPGVRQRSAAYIRRRFPQAGPFERFAHAYRLYLQFGLVLLDRMVAGCTGRFPLCITTPEIRARMDHALNNPQGCIVLTAHMGAWQVGLAGLQRCGRNLHVLQAHAPKAADRHYFELGQGRPFHIIDAAEGPASLVEAATALRRGEVLCLMGDRMPEVAPHLAGQSVVVPFLNGEIALPITAYALAFITKASLLMLLTVHERGATRALWAEEVVVPAGLNRRRPEDFAPYARRFAHGMESMARQYPYQFFNFYDIWL